MTADVMAIRSNFLTVPQVGHSMLISAYDEAEQRRRIRRCARIGMTHVDLCVGLNVGDNPFHQSRWRVNILAPADGERIVHACEQAHELGLFVTGWVFLDDSKKWPDGTPVTLRDRERVINAVGRYLIRRGHVDWLCLGLELGEYLDADEVSDLGALLARECGTLPIRQRIGTHYNSAHWTPHDKSVDNEVKRAWLRANPWVRAVFYQFTKIDDGKPGFTTTPAIMTREYRSVTRQLAMVRPGLLCYPAEYVARRPLLVAVALGRHALQIGAPGFLGGGPGVES